MGAPAPNRALVPVAVPLAAGAIFFAWGFVATQGQCGGVGYDDGVDSWAVVGVLTALFYCAFGVTILARRRAGWLALGAAALTVLALVLGAQVGWAVGMAIAECEWDEGPALTLLLFATPGAMFGYLSGWVLRVAGSREPPAE